MSTKAREREPAHPMCPYWRWRGEAAPPIEPPGFPRRCRGSGLGASPPEPPCRCAHR